MGSALIEIHVRESYHGSASKRQHRFRHKVEGAEKVIKSHLAIPLGMGSIITPSVTLIWHKAGTLKNCESGPGR